MLIRVMTGGLAVIAVKTRIAKVEDWERLRQLSPKASVSIRTTEGKELKGSIRAWKPDGLAIEHGKQVSEMARGDVERISTNVGVCRARRAGWAALIGAGAGAILYIGLCSAGECD